MHSIRELLYILNRYKVRQIEVLTNEADREDPSRYFQFYDQAIQNNFSNDQEAAEWLGLEADGKAYKRFKHEFKRRLYNTILFIDTNSPEFNDAQRARYLCYQRLAVMKTLNSRGLHEATSELAKQILPIAQKYEFTDILLETAQALKQYYAIHNGDRKKYTRYRKLMWEQMEIYQAELLAMDHFQEIMNLNISDSGMNEAIHEQCRESLSTLEAYGHITSFFFALPYLLIKIYERMSIFDWPGTIDRCQEALDFFDQRKNAGKQSLMGIMMQMASAQLMLKQYPEAEKTAFLGLESALPNSWQWFKMQEVLLNIYLHAGRYSEAWDTYRDTTRNPQFSRAHLISDSAEFWPVYHAYLSIIVALGYLELSPREKGELKKFRLGKFLNEVHTFSKNKRGMNIPVLIIQAIILLVEDRLDEMEDRIENLRKYRSHHFKDNSPHIRSSLFIRMLQELPKSDFNRKKVQKNVSEWVDRLQEFPLSRSGQNHDVEIVPYEVQWEWIVSLLK